MRKPKALRKGDVIGVIAPAGIVDPSELSEGIQNLEALGFRVLAGRHVHKHHRYMAGTDDERVQDLHDMFSNPEVAAILCARGGYGSMRLLPLLDRSLLSARPKIVIGSSDITALLIYIVDQLGCVSFHGPMVAPNFGRQRSDLTTQGFLRSVCRSEPKAPLDYQGMQTLQVGTVEGKLVGGNLSMVCALLGTPYEPDTRDSVLFLEDINEPPYRVDRMLSQLKLAGKLEGVRGVVFGKMVNCDPRADEKYTLEDVFLDGLGPFKGPIVYGLPAGHGGEQVTVPLGVQARLDGERGVLTVLEEGVAG